MIRFRQIRWLGALALVAGCAICAPAQSADEIDEYSEQGQQALAHGQFAQAEAAYEKLRELEPGVAEVHANLGLIYFQERKYEPAVSALRQALKLKPALPKTGALLAMSLSELGRYSDALPGLEKGFHYSADAPIKRMCGLQLLRAYAGLRQDSKAVEVALELNRLYPSDAEVLYHTGRVFGNYAFLAMQKLAQVAPASIWRHQAEAEANESQGSNDAAISEYQQVLSVDPRRPGIHYRLGRTLLARSRQNNSPEDITAAAKEFEQELQFNPDNANAAYELGEIHRNAGELDRAGKFFEMATKDHPDFAEAHLGLAFHTHDDPRIRVVSSMSQPLCAVMTPSHALAARPVLSLCDLIRFPMCLPETSFRTRQILKELEIAERVTLQPSVSCNSIALLKSLLLCGDLCTLLPLLAVAEEVERGELIAIPLAGTALQGTSVHLINRLGRRLTPAPLSLMNELTSYLNRYAPRPGAIKSRPTLVADNVRQL